MNTKTPHQEAIDYFYDRYKAKFQANYLVVGGKDCSWVKRMLKTFTLDQYKAIVDQFFISDDPFIKKAGYTISIMGTVANKLVQEIKQNKYRLTTNTKPEDNPNPNKLTYRQMREKSGIKLPWERRKEDDH
jgi:hypothetical protein